MIGRLESKKGKAIGQQWGILIGKIYGTAFELIFTPPVGFPNIDHFEIYVDGVLWDTLKKSGDYVVNLDPGTNYQIYLIAVDDVGFKSVPSLTTNGTTREIVLTPGVGLEGYWRLDETEGFIAFDSHGDHNGQNISPIIGEPGIVNFSYRFSGGGQSYVEIPDTPDLSFTDENGDTPGSVSFWFKLASYNEGSTSVTAEANYMMSRRGSVNDAEWQIGYVDREIRVRLFDQTFNGYNNMFQLNAPIQLDLDVWYHIAVVYDGYVGTKTLRAYINGEILDVDNVTVGVYNRMVKRFLKVVFGYEIGTGAGVDGNLDEVAIFKNVALNPGEISDLFNRGLGNGYVRDTTPPEAVTDLTSATVEGKAVLIFTKPTSRNPVDRYEVFINNDLHTTIQQSGDAIANLEDGVQFNVKIVTVDVYNNKSGFSNETTIIGRGYDFFLDQYPNLLMAYSTEQISANGNDSLTVRKGASTTTQIKLKPGEFLSVNSVVSEIMTFGEWLDGYTGAIDIDTIFDQANGHHIGHISGAKLRLITSSGVFEELKPGIPAIKSASGINGVNDVNGGLALSEISMFVVYVAGNIHDQNRPVGFGNYDVDGSSEKIHLNLAGDNSIRLDGGHLARTIIPVANQVVLRSTFKIGDRFVDFINGSKNRDATMTGVNVIDDFYIGPLSMGVQENFKVAEIIVFNDDKLARRVEIENYIAKRYGIVIEI